MTPSHNYNKSQQFVLSPKQLQEIAMYVVLANPTPILRRLL